jgi:hypothetical protein
VSEFRPIEDRIADHNLVVAYLTQRVRAMRGEFDEKMRAVVRAIECEEAKLRCITDELNRLIAEKDRSEGTR